MTTLEILRDARALYAANPSHAPSGEDLAEGTHCVLSATASVGPSLGTDADQAITQVAGLRCPSELIPWNASHTTAEVLAAFDRAISYEEAKEQEHAWRAFLPAPLELVPA